MHRRQLLVLATLLVVYALAAFASYALFLDSMLASAGQPAPAPPAAPVTLGLVNAAIILIVYGLLGLAGFGLARRLGLPGILSEDGDRARWIFIPFVVGIAAGLLIALLDRYFSGITGLGYHLPQPRFPFSLLASLSAGIGEEILFRGFILGLFAGLLNGWFKRWIPLRGALWAANILAALAFGAAQLPGLIYLAGSTNAADMPLGLIAELFLLNSLIGLAAGERYLRDGLVAAVGVHFWADLVWHVIFPLLVAGR